MCNFIMAKSCYFFLSYENIVANGALNTGSKTGLGAGCFYSRNCYLGVTKCLYYLLLYENVVTNGAVAAFGKTGCSASGSNGCVNYLGMTKCIDNLFIGIFATNTFANALACLRTGRSYAYLPSTNLMPKSVYIIFFVGIAAGAGIGGVALLCAGGGGYDRLVLVAECRDLFLCYDYFVALGAMLSLGFAGFGAGRSNRLIDNDDVLMLFGSGLFFGIDCGLCVRVLNVDQRNFVQKIQRTFTGCQSEQNHRRHNDQNECFEKIFHFSPSKK